jgi:hypothetical protein
MNERTSRSPYLRPSDCSTPGTAFFARRGGKGAVVLRLNRSSGRQMNPQPANQGATHVRTPRGLPHLDRPICHKGDAKFRRCACRGACP